VLLITMPIAFKPVQRQRSGKSSGNLSVEIILSTRHQGRLDIVVADWCRWNWRVNASSPKC
jgi:hypothetical protein